MPLFVFGEQMIGLLEFNPEEPEENEQPRKACGAVGSYIHAGGKIGVLVEVSCETEFGARSDHFQSLIKDIAMQVAATSPMFIRKDDVTLEAYEKEREIYRAQCTAAGKLEPVIEKIVEGKMSKFYETACLMEQPFVKEPSITVAQLIQNYINKLGEHISVRRFARFKVGDADETFGSQQSRI